MNFRLSILALPLLLAALSGCGNSANSAVPADALARGGKSTDVIIPSNVDGENIAFTVHEPTTYVPGAKYPLILEGHGYGGSRVNADSRPAPGASGTMGRLLDAGYGVISVDQRGHGESGGTIRILEPEHEGQDLLQMLDWAEANLAWLAYRDSNLLLGAIGGSYGGGYQHLIYAIDPKHRLDAIAPEITWHDLRYSLYSGHVFKTFWATALSAAGNAAGGGGNTDPEVTEGLAQGYQNDLQPDKLALLYKDSLISYCENNNPHGTLTQIDALYWQSSGDTLFNLTEAVNNFKCVAARGGDVRLLVKTGGHDSLVGGAGGESCGELRKIQSIVDWYDEKLKGVAGKAAYIPRVCFHLDVGGTDAVVMDSLPVPTQAYTVPAQSIVAQEGSAQVASVALTTIGAGGAVLAGVPTIELSVTDPLGQQAGDPIVFVALAKRAAGTTSDAIIMNNQVAPFRGYGTFTQDLIGVTARLAEGDELRLVIQAANQPRYPASGSDAATPVDVAATVNLPLLPPDLPAPPAN
jgi:ABC-2 type transport system ATP-binding protein